MNQPQEGEVSEENFTPERLAAIHWVLTLVDPLLGIRDRDHYLGKMREQAIASPEWSALFYGGVVADQTRTLPATDPWRRLSARVGAVTSGGAPPGMDGAARPDGQPFGTWEDAADVVEPVFDHPQLDPALGAVASGLGPYAAAILGAAGQGWSDARDMAQAVSEVGDLFEAGHAAMSWAMHRRRAYGVQSDPWPIESVYRWSWRADQTIAGGQWKVSSIDEAIERESIEDMLTAGIIHPG